jgi:DNA polymerase III subunit delta'
VPLPPLYGHEPQRTALLRAHRAGALAQSLLLHGPAGIGKERFAHWIAALILCPTPTDVGPCGRCRSCRSVDRLEHPDVHWFFPVSRPEGATPEKLREKLEEARGTELAARRADPVRVPTFERPPAHYLQSILTLQRLASLRPSVGDRKVFVVGDADAMVPQESSQEAANAFLKLLEEPPADTTLILTSSIPGALLPTIVSRVLPVRLLPLGPDTVAAFLERECGIAAPVASALAAGSEGSVGRALRLRDGGPEGALRAERAAGRALLEAALSDDGAARFAAANGTAPAGARGDFTGKLAALALALRDLMAISAGSEDTLRCDGKELAGMRRMATSSDATPEGAARAILHVQEAQRLAGGNVNPQLILVVLLRRIRGELLRPS